MTKYVWAIDEQTALERVHLNHISYTSLEEAISKSSCYPKETLFEIFFLIKSLVT